VVPPDERLARELLDAQDEVGQLRAEVARFRGVLEVIVEESETNSTRAVRHFRRIALRALGREERDDG
jgi:hypothetical protein